MQKPDVSLECRKSRTEHKKSGILRVVFSRRAADETEADEKKEEEEPSTERNEEICSIFSKRKEVSMLKSHNYWLQL